METCKQNHPATRRRINHILQLTLQPVLKLFASGASRITHYISSSYDKFLPVGLQLIANYCNQMTAVARLAVFFGVENNKLTGHIAGREAE